MNKPTVSVLFVCSTLAVAADYLFAQTSTRVITGAEAEKKREELKTEKAKEWIGKAWGTIAGGNDTSNRRDPPSSGPAFPRGFDGEVTAEEWVGKWVRLACTEAGGAADIGCASQPESGALQLRLQRYGSSSVGGTVYVGGYDLYFSGSVDGKSWKGSGHGRNDTVATDVTITNWESERRDESMIGTFTLTFHPDDAAVGTVVIRADLQGMQRADQTTHRG